MNSPDSEEQGVRPEPGAFPIVGIGASAGGLEALEQFLGHLPAGRGLALVIIQHLDPTRPGALPELLQRVTFMPVTQVEDLTPVEPNHVYIIPPNKDLSIWHGVLHLSDPEAPRGLRLPIDFFFRSLAEDRQEQSIGVILSGMGSDGTLGIQAIKERAGLVLAQDPATTQFDSMPRNAIATGQVDIVAPVAELPGRLLAYLEHALFLVARPASLPEEKTRGALDKVILLLHARTGHDFSQYKRSTLYRRVERRMSLRQLDRIDSYIRYLQENPAEQDLLFKEILIGVTRFFRDPAAWQQLCDRALPLLLAERPADQPLRAWVPACATGEEAFSLAIVLQEALDKVQPSPNLTLRIFATDLDRDAIAWARHGFYLPNVAADISPERLDRFFTPENGGYRVTPKIRDRITFAVQNAVMDPPFTRLDLLSCRNLLIYLDSDLQRKLLRLFSYSLRPGGILFLGSAEEIDGLTDLFTPVDGQARIFRRAGGTLAARADFSTDFAPARPGAAKGRPAPTRADLQALLERALVRRYAPATVLVNPQGDILYIVGPMDQYLELPVGKANWNILAMGRPGLRQELAGALALTLRQKEPAVRHNLQVQTPAGKRFVDLRVEALPEGEGLAGTVLVSVSEVAPADRTAAPAAPGSAAVTRVEELEQEVRLLRAEMQAAQEGFAASSEELQSANEELQSTNEELTTSQEEMQSLNEELQTVNAELQTKVDQLSEANSDLKNLLDSTGIATIFLDGGLRVRRFTPRVTRFIRLLPSDVGRPLTDLVSDLRYPELAEDAREVLRTLVPVEKEVAASEGDWLSVCLLPYRTLDNKIDGLVMTFTDISAAKRLEADLRQARSQAEQTLSERTEELARSEERRQQAEEARPTEKQPPQEGRGQGSGEAAGG